MEVLLLLFSLVLNSIIVIIEGVYKILIIVMMSIVVNKIINYVKLCLIRYCMFIWVIFYGVF